MPKRPDDNFLLRWSRKKRGVVEEEEPAAADPSAADCAAGEDDAAQDETAAGAAPEVPAELADVDIDTLDYDSDYTRFLKEGVPDALKRRALRRLWRSDPILANIDGLNDYDDDFSDAALAVDVLKTVHKVGRGYLEDDDEAGDLDETDEADVARDDAAGVTDDRAHQAAENGEPEAATVARAPTGPADDDRVNPPGASDTKPPRDTEPV